MLQTADDVVTVAFQLGLESARRSEYLDPSPGNWSTLVTNISVAGARKAIASFNQSFGLCDNRKAYISAEGTSSTTISGPPSVTARLFETSKDFQDCKQIPLHISAAFHASHLEPVSLAKILDGINPLYLQRSVQHRMIISPSSGKPYVGCTFSELLVEVVDDILQVPMSLETSVVALSKLLDSAFSVLEFGPVNCAKAIRQILQTCGVHIIEDADVPNTRSLLREDCGAIAIVGMAARLPGSETLEEFWSILEEGRDLHEKIRPDRFNLDTHYDPSGKLTNSTLTPYGVFIDRPGYFDTRLFNMSPREASQTDPQQRLMLLTTYEALEMAGYAPNRTPSTSTRRIGSFIGQTSDDWREVNASQNVDTYFITGGIRAFGPGRLNYHFGWEGPSFSLDTACSSSAASIQLACSALLARECDTAVGGGANFLTASDLFAGLSRGSFLSKTGGCKTFDHDADGYVRADGVGVVVLKRLEDAIADRDNIQAVLRGAVTNHSAEAVSITHPHAATQERLFDSVLCKAGVEPHDVDYAELHGTGTQAGDATETRSVTNVLARGRSPTNPLYIGTVKPNLGHGEAASGVTSIIKAVMMLRKNMIPPHIGIKGCINEKLPPLKELNTHISFQKTPFFPRPDGDGKRRILINNFDAAGGNTSMLLEDPPVLEIQGTDPRSYKIVAISAKTTNAMMNNTQKLLEYQRQNPETRLEDIAYTTTARRIHHNLRKAHVVSSSDDLIRSLEKSISSDENWTKNSTTAEAVFVFTGQGSQYASMAHEMFKSHPGFRESILDYEGICVSHGFPSFIPMMTETGLDISNASPVQIQLALVSIQLAIASLWNSFGVSPKAVIGHSLGEYPALCIAGVISVSDCLLLVGKRASLMVSGCTPGSHSMLAVRNSVEDVEILLDELNVSGCEIACVNDPVSTVVSGPVDMVSSLHQQLQAQNSKAARVEVQFAFHSAQMDDVLEEFAAIANKIQFAKPIIPIASTLLGTVVTERGSFDGDYLKRQARQPVQFVAALQALKSQSIVDDRTIWIETGPHPICLSMIRATLNEARILLPSLRRNDGDWKVMASSVAEVYNAGIDIDWSEYHRPYDAAMRLLELPHYAFDLKNHWIQYEGDWAIRKGTAQTIGTSAENAVPPFSTSSLHRIETETDDATGTSVTFASDASEPKLNRALRGHLVNGAGLCPSSVYADMAFTAASYINRSSQSRSSMDVRDMTVHKPLLIHPGQTSQIIRVVASRKHSSEIVEIKFTSQDGAVVQDHANCAVHFGDGGEWKSEWMRNAYLIDARIEHLKKASETGLVHRILRPMVYKLFAALVDYDDKYQGLKEVYMDSNLLEAAANVKFRTAESDGVFIYSPYWIDSLAHLSGFVLNGAETTPADSVFISHGWESMKIVGQLSAEKSYQSYVRMQAMSSRSVMSGDVYFFEDAEIVAVCKGLKFQQIKRSILDHLLPRSSPSPDGFARMRSEMAIQKPQQMKSQQQIVISNATKATDNSDFSIVLGIVASQVGVDRSELLDDTRFADLGIDSLLTISISSKVREELGKELPTTLFSDCCSVNELRKHFAELNGDTGATVTPLEDDSEVSSMSSFSSNEMPVETPVSELSQSSTSAGLSSIEVLRNIIASEVGVSTEEIDDETPLSEIGVDSLLSLSILNTIRIQTGMMLSSRFLIQNPSFGAVKRALGGSSQPSPPEVAKALQNSSHAILPPSPLSILLQGSLSCKPCLFLLPDGSGSASSYVGLPSLNLPGAIYGLNSPFLSSPKSFTVSLQNVASLYVSEIRRIQPHGPYSLGGWSIGGSYAFEVGSQLIRLHGEVVDSLILIDAPCPKVLPPLPMETVDLLEEIGAFDGLKQSAGRRGHPCKSAMRDGVRDHFAGSVNALKQYHPTPLPQSSAPTSVTVLWAHHGVWDSVGDDVRRQFEAREGPRDLAKDWMMESRSSYGASGWESLLPGADIECYIVPGDHFSIMRKPGVLDLGHKIAAAVSRL